MARSPSQNIEFVMDFLGASRRYKSQYVDTWREVLENFTLKPYDRYRGYSQDPYRNSRGVRGRGQVILKDPETHKAIMVYASKLIKATLGDRRKEYIVAQPVGWEDAPMKAPTVSKLLRYAFSIPGHFRSLVESVVDMLLMGTSFVEIYWKYVEREMPMRSVSSSYGITESSASRVVVPTFNDVCINPVDVQDFFPDPSHSRIENMVGCAKRFRMNALQARSMARKGLYESDAVEKAISESSTTRKKDGQEDFREGLDQPTDTDAPSDFVNMVGYDYWGDVPWTDDEGSSRRLITILNGVAVRDVPYPLADPDLPFRELIINPVQGRLYGISPAEVIRHDQDYVDAVKTLLAEAMIRIVHPPIAFDPGSDPDLAALREWRADALIGVSGGPSSIGTLRYDANVIQGFNMANWLKMSMQEASGALGAISGENGPDREAASVGVQRVQNAMDRPEMAAMLLENEAWPGIARSILRRYQQFLDSEEELALRVGEQPEHVWLGDIMGDFDIQFLGSRQAMSRQEMLQAIDRINAYAQINPAFRMFLPNLQIAQWMVGDLLELPRLAAQVGNPQAMGDNALAEMMLGKSGMANGNGAMPSSEPPGMTQAQSAGNVLGA